MISTLQSRPMFRSSWPTENKLKWQFLDVSPHFALFGHFWLTIFHGCILVFIFCVFLWGFFLSAFSWSFWWAGLLREKRCGAGGWGFEESWEEIEEGEAWLAWLNETGFQLQKETGVLYEFRTKEERRTSQGRGNKMYSYVVIEIRDGETGAGGLNGEGRGLLVLGDEGEKEHEVRWEDLWGAGGLGWGMIKF